MNQKRKESKVAARLRRANESVEQTEQRLVSVTSAISKKRVEEIPVQTEQRLARVKSAMKRKRLDELPCETKSRQKKRPSQQTTQTGSGTTITKEEAVRS